MRIIVRNERQNHKNHCCNGISHNHNENIYKTNLKYMNEVLILSQVLFTAKRVSRQREGEKVCK